MKGASGDILLLTSPLQLLFRSKLQHRMHESKGQKMISCGPEFDSRNLPFLSCLGVPSQPTSYLALTESTKQNPSLEAGFYGLPCALHKTFLIPICPAPASAFREMGRLLNMDLYHLQDPSWPICEIALCLLQACTRDILFPLSSSSIDGFGLSACQLSLGTV